MKNDTDASKRGDELCVRCKREWREHKDEQLRCPSCYSKDDVFTPSGRFIPKRPSVTVNEASHYFPSFEQHPLCRRCNRHHEPPCRIVMGAGR